MALGTAAFLADVAFFSLVLLAIPCVLIAVTLRKGSSH
jgi:hypothetical protein